MNKNIMSGFYAKKGSWDRWYVNQIRDHVSNCEKKRITRSDINAIIESLSNLKVGFSKNLIDVILNKIGENKDVKQYFFDGVFKHISDPPKDTKYEVNYKSDVKNYLYDKVENIMKGFKSSALPGTGSYAYQIKNHISQIKKNIDSKMDINAIIFELKELGSGFDKDLINIILDKIGKNDDVKKYFFDKSLKLENDESIKKYLLKLSGKDNIMLDFKSKDGKLDDSYANQIAGYILDKKGLFSNEDEEAMFGESSEEFKLNQNDIDAIFDELKNKKAAFNSNLLDVMLKNTDNKLKIDFVNRVIDYSKDANKMVYGKKDLPGVFDFILNSKTEFNKKALFDAMINNNVINEVDKFVKLVGDLEIGFNDMDLIIDSLNKLNIKIDFNLVSKMLEANPKNLDLLLDSVVNDGINLDESTLSKILDFGNEFSGRKFFGAANKSGLIKNKNLGTEQKNKIIDFLNKIGSGNKDFKKNDLESLKFLNKEFGFEFISRLVGKNSLDTKENLDYIIKQVADGNIKVNKDFFDDVLKSEYDFSGKIIFDAMSKNGEINSLRDVIKFCDLAGPKIESLDLGELIYFLSSWTYAPGVFRGVSNLIGNANSVKDVISLANKNFIVSLVPDNYLPKYIKDKIADVDKAELIHLDFSNIEESKKSIDSIKLFYENGVLNYLVEPNDRKKIFSFVMEQLRKEKMMDYMFSFVKPAEINDENKNYVAAMREIFDSTVPKFINLAEECALKTLENKDSMGMFLENLKLVLDEIKNIGSKTDKENITNNQKIEDQNDKKDDQPSIIENPKIRTATIEIVNAFVKLLDECVEVNTDKDALANLNSLIPTLKEIIEINNVYQSENPDYNYVSAKSKELIEKAEKILKVNPKTLEAYKNFLKCVFKQAKANVDQLVGNSVFIQGVAIKSIDNLDEKVVKDGGLTNTLKDFKNANALSALKFWNRFGFTGHKSLNIVVTIASIIFFPVTLAVIAGIEIANNIKQKPLKKIKEAESKVEKADDETHTTKTKALIKIKETKPENLPFNKVEKANQQAEKNDKSVRKI